VAVLEVVVLSLPGVADLDPAAQSGEERAPPAGGADIPEEIRVSAAGEAIARVGVVDRTLMAGISPPL